jgi:hypothetical protein
LKLKIKDFFIFDQSDLTSLDLYFIHFTDEFLFGKFNMSEEQTIMLAAYKLIAEFGGSLKNVPFFIAGDYVPKNKDSSKLEKKCSELLGLTSKEAKVLFLEELRGQVL